VTRLAHISDTHIAYSAYRALAANGENQRSVDIARAFAKNVEEIIAWDPPLVVHSGDIADRVNIPVKAMLFIRQQLEKLASIRPDGSRRQVVVIAGNHELPSRRSEACFLELYRDLPGVHIVCDEYKVIRFSPSEESGVSEELRGVAVHCVPHDTWKDLAHEQRMDEVQPIPGMQNVLLAHGVAGGSTLFKRVMGREYHIPTEVLAREWEYGALGHWHKRGPVGPGGSSSRIWYAGSTENNGFGDIVENDETRGHLRVTLQRGDIPKVQHIAVPIRAMFRVPVLDAAGLTPEEITKALVANLKKVRDEGRLAGAVVGQVVTGVPRDVWALVDATPARQLGEAALHYELTVRPVHLEKEDGERKPNMLSGLDEVLDELAKSLVRDEDQRNAAVSMARTLLGRHLAHVVDDDAADAAKKDESEPQEVSA
jgi:DNA repair exonuclease SbcCD nuclease subunit